MMSLKDIESKLRQVPDFPKPGINFLDMSPALADGATLQAIIEGLAAPYLKESVDKVIAIESRGFILGAALAQRLGCGLVMVRKKGKLPGPLLSVSAWSSSMTYWPPAEPPPPRANFVTSFARKF